MRVPARSRLNAGIRFRLFPQFDEGYDRPEEVVIDLAPGLIGPGPADPWMYVANAIDKTRPYDPPVYLPPYTGAVFAPAIPDRAGNFDRIPVDAPQFRAAHTYGVVRYVVDTWERYLGQRIAWWFAPQFARLELGPMVAWDNAQSGPGFLEAGLHVNANGTVDPYWVNFDVLAHEAGHVVMFSTIGVPGATSVHGQFLAFHEAFADLFALNAALQFRSVRLRLLHETGGNLYVGNAATRIGELTTSTQVRIASNDRKMADVAGLRLAADGTWIDPWGQGRGVFALAAPLIGAVFDMLVEIYQDGLVARGLIRNDMGPDGWSRAEIAASLARIEDESGRAFARFADGFEATLDDARDSVALCMAHVMHTIRADVLTFELVAARMLEGAERIGLGRLLPELLAVFVRRGIDPQRLQTANAIPSRERAGHGAPAGSRACPTCGLHTGFLLANGLLKHEHRRWISR